MPSTKVEFRGSQTSALRGLIDEPETPPRAYALFAHCFTCSKNFKAVTYISRALTAQNIAVLRFDFTGLGESEGDFADTNFTSNVDDLIAASGYLETVYEGPKVLIGHSLGGTAVLQAARRIDTCRAVATIGAPYDPEHVANLFAADRERIETEGEADITLASRKFTIKRQFLDDLGQGKAREVIGSLGKPLLIFHSPIDNTVGIDNAAEIFQAARHPKSFISLDGADHLLSNEADARYVGAVTAQWAERYI